MAKVSYRNIHTSNNKHPFGSIITNRMTAKACESANDYPLWADSTPRCVVGTGNRGCGGSRSPHPLEFLSLGNRDVTYVCIPNNILNTLGPSENKIQVCNTFIHTRVSDISSALCPASSTQLCLCSFGTWSPCTTHKEIDRRKRFTVGRMYFCRINFVNQHGVLALLVY